MQNNHFRLQNSLFDNTVTIDVFDPERAWTTAGRIEQTPEGLLRFAPAGRLQHFANRLPKFAPAILGIDAFAEKIAGALLSIFSKLDAQMNIF